MDQKSSRLVHKPFHKAAKEELSYMLDRMSGKRKSLKTCWKKFNQVSMNGIEWGSIITIAGMSGSGKTAILNEMETSLFKQNPDEKFAVLSFNFEMLARRLVGRKISAKLNKSVKQLYSADLEEKDKNLTKEDLELAKEYIESIKNLPIYYVDMPGTPVQIREAIYRINDLPEVRDKKLLITLDHSILVKKTPGKDQMETLYDLSFEANQIKKNIDSSFIFLSQLNRSIESTERRQNSDLHYPTKADIFGADALYQYSDVVLVPHRPEMLGIREYGPNKLSTEGFIYWHYLKVRDGDPVIAKMVNDLKHNRVLEYVPPPNKAWSTKVN